MTHLERKSLAVFQKVLLVMTGGKIGKDYYRDICGEVRDMVYTLERSQSGCPTGLHFSDCTCIEAQRGHCLDYFKRKRRETQ